MARYEFKSVFADEIQNYINAMDNPYDEAFGSLVEVETCTSLLVCILRFVISILFLTLEGRFVQNSIGIVVIL